MDKPASVTVNGDQARQWTLPGGREWAFEAKVLTTNGSTQNITINATDQGNRTTSTVWQVDNAHSASNFTYDADGNMLTQTDNAGSNITAKETSYTWDSLGRITGYDDGTSNVTFGYDPLGRRNKLTATVANVTTTEYYLWDDDSIVQQRSTSGGNATRKYYGSGFQVMNTTTGNVTGNYFYTTDHLGSIREVVTGSGNTTTLVGRYNYDAWGETQYFDYTGGNVTQPDFGYAGYFRSAYLPNTYLTLARPYLPSLRRWLGPDPIGAGLSGYDYAGNDPVNNIDPSGLLTCTISGGYLLGVKMIVGYNRGQLTWGLYIGVGQGVEFDFDLMEGDLNPVGTTYGIEGTGILGVGRPVSVTAHIGLGDEFGHSSSEFSYPMPGTALQGAVILKNDDNGPTFQLSGPTVSLGEATVIGIGGMHSYTPSSPSPKEPPPPPPLIETGHARPYDGSLFDL